MTATRPDPQRGDGAPADPEELVALIRESLIGRTAVADGPYGSHRLVYADYTASGRSLEFIEDYIRAVVLPWYANTHTETSQTGLQTTRLREDAREIIRAAVGATDEHAVLFCGSGATGAVDRLVAILGLRIPAGLQDRYGLLDAIPVDERPVVFIGPYEHHSNELPWRESIADVVAIDEDSDGHIDLGHLEHELERYAARPLKIGSFSAASNVTGIVTDTSAVSTLLHRRGALSFWDFAAAAPYIAIDVRGPGSGDPLDYKDAVFLSPHKFVGGPGTPGVLVVRRELMTNRVPAVPGGGTVSFVNAEAHRFVEDAEHREEGGTPAIVESIRAGLVFQLQQEVGIEFIRQREHDLVSRAMARWAQVDNLDVLGNRDAERLSIVSFVVRCDGGYLHHNFVVALLNDLFGIQARGGCSCAGPYGHRLLGIDLTRSRQFEQEVLKGSEGIKPGWVRVNFNYFIDEDEFEYLVDAVGLVAEQGERMLPDYDFDPWSGRWWHRGPGRAAPTSLGDIDYRGGRMRWPSLPARPEPVSLREQLEQAAATLARGPVLPPAEPSVARDEGFEQLRWFPLATIPSTEHDRHAVQSPGPLTR